MRNSTLPEYTGPRNDLRTIKALVPYLWPAAKSADGTGAAPDAFEMRFRVLLAMAFLVLAKGANVLIPVFYKFAVDALTGATSAVIAVPVGLLLGYGLVRMLALAFAEARGAIFAKVAQRAIRQAGLKTFRHLHRLSLRFHLDRRTGSVTRAVERGTRAIEFLLRYTLFNILPTLLEIGMVIVILWGLYGVWFSAVTFVTLGGYIFFTVMVTEWRTQFRRSMNEADSNASTKAIDSLLNFETVKYFGNEDHETRRFDGALATYEDAAIKSQVSLAWLNSGQGIIVAIGATVLMLMAAIGVTGGTMTIGDFVLVNTYLIQLFLPLSFLGSTYREIKHSLIDVEAMFALLGEAAEIRDAPGATPLQTAGGELRFEDVRFGYDPRRQVLGGVSFTVPAGRTVAIVGPSGAGKSTISRLLFRFYDADGGRILIDGQNIARVTQKSLRAAIGIVPQDTVLFNDTIYYNIAYGDPGAGPAEVERAARLAHIHDFVMQQPDGYQTRVGERGLKLSGGEKQRVAIARTILKKPAILLFDEATSALDSHTEKDIQASLAEVSRDRTTLTIAHRLSTIIDADEILVLNQGRIAERGTHAGLLTAGGLYAGMWRRQQEAAMAEETLERALGAAPATAPDGAPQAAE